MDVSKGFFPPAQLLTAMNIAKVHLLLRLMALYVTYDCERLPLSAYLWEEASSSGRSRSPRSRNEGGRSRGGFLSIRNPKGTILGLTL